MAKILIAEDDEFFRDILTDFLDSKGHKVTAVPNGKVARDVVLTGGFDLVVSDVQMPFLNGVELLQWLRTESKMPFILMTGFTNLLETKKAAEMGADGFLSKPFSNKDLERLIQDIVNPAPELTVQPEADTEYCKVSIDEFVARPKIEFDIYVQLQSGKHLKVAHTGEILDIARLKSYKEKGVNHLFIKKEDFSKLVNFNIEVLKVLQNADAINAEKKARFLRYTSEVVMESCYVRNMDESAFHEAQQFLNASLGAISAHNQMHDMLSMLNEHGDHIYAHSLGVSIYSVMIAKKMQIHSSQTLFKLAMAGLFHDIGKKEIEREILEKPRAMLTVAQRKLYESHAMRGCDIMGSIPGIPSDVLQIIAEHHEDECETGYPLGKQKLRLHPLSRIIHVADIFVTRAVRGPAHAGMSSAEALRLMETFDLDRMNKQAFEALKAVSDLKKVA